MSKRDREMEQRVMGAIMVNAPGEDLPLEVDLALEESLELDWGLDEAVDESDKEETRTTYRLTDEYTTPLGQRKARRSPYNSFRKVNVKKTKEHVYTYVNGEQYVVTAGEDGVTQEFIDELNRAHNRQVEQNCKVGLMPKTKEEREAEAAEALALGLKKPWRYKRRAVLSLNGFIETLGPLADHLSCFADPKTLNGVEGELGLCESPLIDALREAIDALPEVEKRAIQLVYLEGYTITQAAKIEGCRNESTLRMRLNRAKAKLGLNKKLEKLYRPDQSKKDTTKKDTTKKE